MKNFKEYAQITATCIEDHKTEIAYLIGATVGIVSSVAAFKIHYHGVDLRIVKDLNKKYMNFVPMMKSVMKQGDEVFAMANIGDVSITDLSQKITELIYEYNCNIDPKDIVKGFTLIVKKIIYSKAGGNIGLYFFFVKEVKNELNYHNITKDDMLNGDGIRVVLWVAGCSHLCKNCQNPITWDPEGGIEFDHQAIEEILDQLDKDYCSGITYSGGDPLHSDNRSTITNLSVLLRALYPNKTQWLYTGYLWEDVKNLDIMDCINVVVDGKFVEELKDVNYHWAGSTNQRVIDVQESLRKGEVVLWR